MPMHIGDMGKNGLIAACTRTRTHTHMQIIIYKHARQPQCYMPPAAYWPAEA